MKFLFVALAAFAKASAFVVAPMGRSSQVCYSATTADDGVTDYSATIPEAPTLAVPTPDNGLAELKSLALDLNPAIPYFDPLDLAGANIDDPAMNRSVIGWLRQSEIKHGRVAMAAFVGFWVQSINTFKLPLTLNGVPFPSADLSPQEQWDVLPLEGKLQIILFVGFLEFIDEDGKFDPERDEFPHYTNGRMPGMHPLFQRKTKRSAESLAEGRLKEINNGRLAMLGIFGFVSEGSIQGSVPLLHNVVKSYSGNIWAPFETEFASSVVPLEAVTGAVSVVAEAGSALQ